ncbi:hypothetical protein HK405_013507, partial [Cladochytrium tenue]
YAPDADDLLVAAAFGLTEVVTTKVYRIDLGAANYSVAYDARASYAPYNSSASVADAAATIGVQVRYPALESVYEKEYLPFDMNNWLGEVGGVAALLMFLYRSLSFFLSLALLHSSKFSEAKSNRNNYTE